MALQLLGWGRVHKIVVFAFLLIVFCVCWAILGFKLHLALGDLALVAVLWCHLAV